MNTENSNSEDLHDRLLDQALRETLGGEAPPDLTEQILAAAEEQPSEVSTRAIGDEATSLNHERARKARKYWAGFAVAASLLVAAGLLVLPAFQASREAATRPSSSSRNTTGELQESVDHDSSSNSLSSIAVSEGRNALLDGIKRKDSSELESSSEEADSLVMGVTPRIIVQEGEEVRLGVVEHAGESLAAASAPNEETGRVLAESRPQRDSSNERLTGIPVQSSQPGSAPADAFPNSKAFQEISDRKKKHDSVDLSGPRERLEYRESLVAESEPVEVDSFYAGRLARRAGPQPYWAFGLLKSDDQGEVAAGTFFDRSLDRIANRPHIGQQLGDLEEGSGPRASGDQYTRIYENPFVTAEGEAAVSTFSIDVDTASYANVRQFLMQSRRLPPPDAVRLEELVNYFDYDYSGPTGDVPFTSHVEVAGCPWNAEHRLLRVGIKGREVELENRPQSNLVFLIDVSGSMNEPAKLPLLVEGMKLLTRELGENDRVAIVVYASSEGLALESTRGDQQDTILGALEKLRAGGSTAGGAGIQLAYQIAEDHFIEGGTNRVILATDGDFNVGTTSTAELERMAEAKAKETGVFLTVLGFGRGNLNDSMMEAISGKGNGNYHYIDNQTESRKVLVEEMTGTLLTIAKDVKIQIEFNPAKVAGYRLLGYENRMLRTEDFNDDKKDAGEIGAGHTVTALYELVPAGKVVGAGTVDPLKYQVPAKTQAEVASSDDLLTLKIRYKQPDGDTSSKLEFPITDSGQPFAEASDDFKFAAAVASFGMLLRDSEHRGDSSLGGVLEIAEEGSRRDPHGYRAEFLQLVRQAKELRGE